MIVVGTTLAAFVMDQEDTWASWCRNAEEVALYTPEEVRYFVAIETDARGMEPFEPLLGRLLEIEAVARTFWWSYSLDDGREEVTTANRLRHLTMGQNLASEFVTAEGASHLLFMAADCQPPVDAIPKLMEVNHGLVGGHVSTYGFKGEPVRGYPFPVERHMPTAAFVLIRRDLFKRLRWRVDVEMGMTDDPSYAYDAETLFGIQPLIRTDVVGRHFPDAIGPIESRGHDMTVHR